MCGIAGAIAREANPAVARVTRDLTNALVHRGPDGEGLWLLDGDGVQPRSVADAVSSVIALGHRRLSIVDLATGAQPLASEDGSVWVSFNGEIYNFAELRRELEARGHRFRTNADTEVLVHGWEEWRTELFGRLNGIFAFALVDAKSRSVMLVRDPLGVKPLFVGVSAGVTWWCSELRAAVKAGLTGGAISADALRLFLTFRFIPSPATIYPNAAKLPPGHYCIISQDQAGVTPAFVRFSSRVHSSAQPRSTDEWREALAHELRAAVGRQMMSDVPVGSLLSGGVDSAVVTRLMSEASTTPPQSFAIGFRDGAVADETQAAETVARELALPLTTVVVSGDTYRSAWPRAMQALDEPIGNPGQLLVGMLCAEVRKSHKVVLSGQGADEPLGGYPRHMAERLWHIGRRAPAISAWIARSVLGSDAGERLTRVLRQRDRIDRIVDILAVMAPEHADRLVYGEQGHVTTRELARQVIGRWSDESSDEDSLNALLKVDARLSLADDLLLVADHFSMQSSVELRVPFLDLAFIELAERMPSRYKVSRWGERKWLYRSMAARLLPGPTAARLCGIPARLGRKQGFSTPTSLWSSVGEQQGPIADLIDWRRVQAESGTLGVRQRVALASLTAWSANAA